MAATVAAVLLGSIVGQLGDPTDIESDNTAATRGTLNVKINNVAGAEGFIVFDEAQAAEAGLTNGPCSITISQGAGSLSAVTTVQ